MRNRSICLILFLTFTILVSSIASVSAQQIDVENMNNEQLTTLLLQILDKLQQEETPAADTASEAKSSETPVPTATLAPVIEPEPEAMGFSVYENKKLTVEALPAYMFIRPTQPPKPEREPGGRQNSGGDNGSKVKSPEECENHCAYDACPWADLVCYWNCYYSCIGEPVPDWMKN